MPREVRKGGHACACVRSCAMPFLVGETSATQPDMQTKEGSDAATYARGLTDGVVLAEALIERASDPVGAKEEPACESERGSQPQSCPLSWGVFPFRSQGRVCMQGWLEMQLSFCPAVIGMLGAGNSRASVGTACGMVTSTSITSFTWSSGRWQVYSAVSANSCTVEAL